MRRWSRRTSLAVLASALLAAPAAAEDQLAAPAAAEDQLAAPAAAEDQLTARLEVRGRYYRAGEPVVIRISLENEAEAPIANAEGIPLLSSLELTVGDEAVTATAVPEFDAGSQPRVFAPGASHLQVVDLAPHFPALREAGTYTLRFKAGDLESNSIDLVLAPPYDPDLDYHAVFKTDFGDMTFDLLEDVAPEHVRNFVDLARRGFFDDTLFHVVARGEMIVGGDPQGDGTGGPGWFLDPEISNRPHERGTISSLRTEDTPDNGSQFFIDLRRAPQRDGKFTVFGKMLDGNEALRALENVATSGRNYQPYYKPLQDTFLRDVIIREAGPEPGDMTQDEEAPGR